MCERVGSPGCLLKPSYERKRLISSRHSRACVSLDRFTVGRDLCRCAGIAEGEQDAPVQFADRPYAPCATRRGFHRAGVAFCGPVRIGPSRHLHPFQGDSVREILPAARQRRSVRARRCLDPEYGRLLTRLVPQSLRQTAHRLRFGGANSGRQAAALRNGGGDSDESVPRDMGSPRSIPHFIQSYVETTVPMYAMYQPLRVLFYIGTLLTLIGLLPIIRFLYFYLLGQGGRHLQSLILGGVLLMMGLLAYLVGLVADLIGLNRQLLEMTLEHIRKLELTASGQ